MQSVGNYICNTTKKLGSGAFGTVYLGHHNTNPSIIVAVKCIERNTSHLNDEIEALTALNQLRNENIVSLYDLSVLNHKVYLIMNYCNGGNLEQHLEVNGKLSERRIRFFLRQLANGMTALSAIGVVHRDLKPANILINYETHVRDTKYIILKIGDFGISRFLQYGQNAHTVIGTPAYVAPEVRNMQPYNAKADMWSLGVIVYQCLTTEIFNGHLRFSGSTSRELQSLLVSLLQTDVVTRLDLNGLINNDFLTRNYTIFPKAEEA